MLDEIAAGWRRISEHVRRTGASPLHAAVEPDCAGGCRRTARRRAPRLSTFGRARASFAAAGVLQVNTHVDPIAWHEGGGLVDTTRLDCADRGATCGPPPADWPTIPSPIGLLTHHLVQDEATWSFTACVLEIVGGKQRLGIADGAARQHRLTRAGQPRVHDQSAQQPACRGSRRRPASRDPMPSTAHRRSAGRAAACAPADREIECRARCNRLRGQRLVRLLELGRQVDGGADDGDLEPCRGRRPPRTRSALPTPRCRRRCASGWPVRDHCPMSPMSSITASMARSASAA